MLSLEEPVLMMSSCGSIKTPGHRVGHTSTTPLLSMLINSSERHHLLSSMEGLYDVQQGRNNCLATVHTSGYLILSHLSKEMKKKIKYVYDM